MCKRSDRCMAVFLAISFLFFAGCEEMNRKQFSQLRPTGVEQGSQYFQYKTSTGASGATCSPGSKYCKVDNSRRADLWPLDDKQAEQTRMEWLKKSLSEKGYQETDYEILSRTTIDDEDISTSEGKYSVLYDVRIKRF